MHANADREPRASGLAVAGGAKKLEPGSEYVISFTFANTNAADLKACFRLAPVGEVNPNEPETLIRALDLQRVPQIEQVKFHRHYCLAASR